ncbi:Ribosome biogenesis protein UTP30 [Nakaseomyces bracarensis]|uniref:Ribosome biogenesis protein UTP30 n=1 Tax=Nakaseomyces bracarensis TaxID=273131 RepID=A0ABR4P0Y0_9SACH
MATVLDSELVYKGLDALRAHCEEKNETNQDVQLIIHTGKKLGLKKDYVRRIIPLKRCRMNKPSDFRILLITKDPSTKYRDVLTKDELTSELFKEIVSIKNLKRRFRGSKLTSLYKEFDLVVADYRVHHLLPDILGNRFYQSGKKTPYMIRINKSIKEKRSKMDETVDIKYIKAQMKSICKNTSYLPNDDNCINVKVGHMDKQSNHDIFNIIEDVLTFLTDRNEKPVGGVIKGGVKSLQIKTNSSTSIPIYYEKEKIAVPNEKELKL